MPSKKKILKKVRAGLIKVPWAAAWEPLKETSKAEEVPGPVKVERATEQKPKRESKRGFRSKE